MHGNGICCVLLAFVECIVVLGFGRFGIGTSQSPSISLRCPFMINSLFLVTVITSLSNYTLQLLSHNFPSDINDELVRLGKIVAFVVL